MDMTLLWEGLLRPMLRLVAGLALGLLIANMLEALRWTRHLAKLAAPLARWAHMGEVAAASFSLSFVSAASSSALLAEAYDNGELSRKELILANLFNSLPAYLLHTPTIFFLTWPVLGFPALVYVGLTLLAAAGRTALTVVVARLCLPLRARVWDGMSSGENGEAVPCSAARETLGFCRRPSSVAGDESQGQRWQQALHKAWARFVRRLPKLVYFTVPVYVLMFALQHYGYFALFEAWMSEHAGFLSFIKPQAMGIVLLHIAAELGAALSAAGSVLHSGALSVPDIVLALLVGNILSTPMRAIRHQFPSYAGYFRPSMALLLIVANQGLRALSLIVMTIIYYFS